MKRTGVVDIKVFGKLPPVETFRLKFSTGAHWVRERFHHSENSKFVCLI